LGGLRHGGSGRACPDHVDVAEAGEVAAGEVAGDGVGGIGGGERGAEDGRSVAAEGFGGHGRCGVEFERCDARPSFTVSWVGPVVKPAANGLIRRVKGEGRRFSIASRITLAAGPRPPMLFYSQ